MPALMNSATMPGARIMSKRTKRIEWLSSHTGRCSGDRSLSGEQAGVRGDFGALLHQRCRRGRMSAEERGRQWAMNPAACHDGTRSFAATLRGASRVDFRPAAVDNRDAHRARGHLRTTWQYQPSSGRGHTGPTYRCGRGDDELGTSSADAMSGISTSQLSSRLRPIVEAASTSVKHATRGVRK